MLQANQKYCCQKKDPSTKGASDYVSSYTYYIGSAYHRFSLRQRVFYTDLEL